LKEIYYKNKYSEFIETDALFKKEYMKILKENPGLLSKKKEIIEKKFNKDLSKIIEKNVKNKENRIKKRLIIISLAFLLLSPSICLATPKQNINWDKIEYYLYRELRSENPDKSEAEIERAVGYGLLSENQWERAIVHFKKALELDPTLFFSLCLIYTCAHF
jgi:Tetratricopeptide repeat.